MTSEQLTSLYWHWCFACRLLNWKPSTIYTLHTS